jgi:hypothetical protein
LGRGQAALGARWGLVSDVGAIQQLPFHLFHMDDVTGLSRGGHDVQELEETVFFERNLDGGLQFADHERDPAVIESVLDADQVLSSSILHVLDVLTVENDVFHVILEDGEQAIVQFRCHISSKNRFQYRNGMESSSGINFDLHIHLKLYYGR